MSEARKRLDWEKMFDLSIEPGEGQTLPRHRETGKKKTPAPCAVNFCAVKNMNRILDGEIVSIYDE